MISRITLPLTKLGISIVYKLRRSRYNLRIILFRPSYFRFFFCTVVTLAGSGFSGLCLTFIGARIVCLLVDFTAFTPRAASVFPAIIAAVLAIVAFVDLILAIININVN